jgi:hypothetical protein
MKILLALLLLAGSAHAQEFTAPDGVNKCINTGMATQCTLLGVLPSRVIPGPGEPVTSMSPMPRCDDGYELVLRTDNGITGYPMCAKDLKPPK